MGSPFFHAMVYGVADAAVCRQADSKENARDEPLEDEGAAAAREKEAARQARAQQERIYRAAHANAPSFTPPGPSHRAPSSRSSCRPEPTEAERLARLQWREGAPERRALAESKQAAAHEERLQREMEAKAASDKAVRSEALKKMALAEAKATPAHTFAKAAGLE